VPIVVEHGGGDIGGLALLALLAGAGRQWPAPQAPQIGGIGSPGGSGAGSKGSPKSPKAPDSAYKPTQYRPAQDTLEQIKQAELNALMEQKRQEAKFEADQWESKFSAQQRQEIAGFNKARQDITRNPRLTLQEKERAIKAIDLEQANIKPNMVLRDPNKPSLEQIEKMQSTRMDPVTGATMGFSRNQEPRVVLKYADSLEGLREKREYDRESKREEKMADFRMKLASEDIIEGTGEDRKPRLRTSEEVDKIMQSAFGIKVPQQEKQQWWEGSRLNIEESDKKLPSRVGYSRAYLRTVQQRYGSSEDVPKKYREKAAEAADTLRGYREKEEKKKKRRAKGMKVSRRSR